MIQAWLDQVEKHIVEADVYIVRQRRRVADLQPFATDSDASRALLARLEDAQSRRIERRDFLRRASRQGQQGAPVQVRMAPDFIETSISQTQEHA